MSCFFCDSFYHLSQNCDKYISDESRQNFAKVKNCCCNCFQHFEGYKLQCKRCKLYKKCYICFSDSHHTFLCQHRKNVSPFFIPDINEDLLPRFIQFLNLEEQYSLAFTSPLALKAAKLKRLSRLYRYDNELIKNSNLNFVITEYYDLSSTKSLSSTYISPLKSVILKCKHIRIDRAELTAQEFMQLLSVHLKHGSFSYVKVLPPVTFSSMIKAAPNMVNIGFSDTNITIESSWPDDILKWKNGNDLVELSIPLQNFNFDIRSFVAVLKEKSSPSIRISLDITDAMELTKSHKEIIKEIENKMLSHFKICSAQQLSDYMGDIHINLTLRSDDAIHNKKHFTKPVSLLTKFRTIKKSRSQTQQLKSIILFIKR